MYHYSPNKHLKYRERKRNHSSFFLKLKKHLPKKTLAILVILAVTIQLFHPLVPFLPSPFQGKIKLANADITSATEKEDILFKNENPEFKVEFGKKQEAEKPFVRFQSIAQGENPFAKGQNEEIQEGFFTRLVNKFIPAKEHGIEFGLVEAGVSDGNNEAWSMKHETQEVNNTNSNGNWEVSKKTQDSSSSSSNSSSSPQMRGGGSDASAETEGLNAEGLNQNQNQNKLILPVIGSDINGKSKMENGKETNPPGADNSPFSIPHSPLSNSDLDSLKQELQNEQSTLNQLRKQLAEMLGEPAPTDIDVTSESNDTPQSSEFTVNQIMTDLTKTETASSPIESIKEGNKDTVRNLNVVPGVDLKYQVKEGEGLKEEIVLNNNEGFTKECIEKAMENGKWKMENKGCSLPKNTYTFSLKLDPGVKMRRAIGIMNEKNPQGVTYFTDENNKYLFHFEPLFAIDAKGNKTDAVRLEIVEDNTEGDNLGAMNNDKMENNINGKWKMENGKETIPPSAENSPFSILHSPFIPVARAAEQKTYTMKITVDLNWLLSPDRAYPIKIDPSIVHNTKVQFDAGSALNRVETTSEPKIQEKNLESKADAYTVGLWHMNETSGSNVADSSGKGNNGTATGTTIVDGKMGKARSFNGTSSDYVSLSNQISFSDTSNFTLETWYKGTDIAQNGEWGKVLIGRDNGDLYANLVLRNGYAEYIHYYSAWLHNIKSQTMVADGSWHHIALVHYNSEKADLFIDGKKEINAESSSINNDSYPFRIDYFMRGYNGQYTSGSIDDVKISNTALTPEQIKADALKRPDASYTSSVLDLTSSITSIDSLQWNESGVQTGDGETPFSSTGLVGHWKLNYEVLGNNITTVDSTGNVGHYTSLALGSDGFARISYRDVTNGDLKFVQCTNTSCSTKNITTVDSTGDVGWNNSITLGSDGFARISYYDATNQNLKFAQCTNASCSTKNITLVDSVWGAGYCSSLNLGADGFARISYSDGQSGDLKFVQCTDASCSTKNIVTVDSTGYVGWFTSAALGSDGFARISYTDITNGDLKFVQCTNASCSTSTNLTTAVDSSGSGNNGTLTNFSNTTGQDVLTNSGWTANNAKWPRSSPKALMFDGSDDYVSVPASGDNVTKGNLGFNHNEDFTVSTWYKGYDNSSSDWGKGLVSWNNTAIYGGLVIRNNKAEYIHAALGVWQHNIISNSSVNDGQWKHIIYVNSGGYGSMYVNGVKETASSLSSTMTGGDGSLRYFQPKSIGSNYNGAYTSGTIDNVQIYSRALSADEILANYNATNIEFQTRTGATATPDDGSWEDWKPNGSESQLDSLDSNEDNTRVYDWGVSNAGANQNWIKKNNVAPGTCDSGSPCSYGDGRLGLGTSGKGDSVDINNVFVIKDGSTYKMWYNATDGTSWRIYYATSPDGLTWTKYDNTIPANSDTTSTNGRIPLGTSGKGDSSNISHPTVIKDGSTYKMWYNAANGANNRIYYATSPDGLTWTKYDNTTPTASDTTSTNGRIPVGTSGKGDSNNVNSASVVKDGSTYKMWYGGWDGTNGRIFYATSPDGLTWTKYDNTIPATSDTISTNGRMSIGTSGRGDTGGLEPSTVIKDGSIYKMFYSAYAGSNWRNFYASSSDGLTWVKYDNTIPNASNTVGTNGRVPLGTSNGDSYNVSGSAVIKDSASYKIWYNGYSVGGAQKIYYATLNPLPFSTSTSTTIKAEGSGSEKISEGQPQSDAATVGLWHLDETGGTGAYLKDVSGSGNNGTPTGTTLVEGIAGKARSFNGSSDYFTIADSDSLDLTTTGTVEAWIKPSVISTNTTIIGRNVNGYFLGLYATGKLTWGKNAVDEIQSGTTLVAGNWYYVVGVHSGGVNYLYVNGALDNSASRADFAALADPVYVGKHPNTTGWYFNGIMDEIKISNIARTAEEITENYRMGRDHRVSRTITSTDLSSKTKLPFWVAGDRAGTYMEATAGESAFANYEPDANTVGLWHLDEQSGSGAYIKDSSNFGNHGTPTGTTFTQGKIGRARKFNGTNDYVIAGASGMPAPNAPQTLSAWYYVASNPTTVQDIVGVANDSSGGIQIGFRSETAYNLTVWKFGGTPLVSFPPPSPSAWHYVTYTFDGTTHRLYIDGQEKNNSTVAPNSALPNKVLFGAWKDTSFTGEYFSGSIDEFRIDNIARTPSEIRQAYEVGLRTHPITIDFSAKLDAGNLITGSGDTGFTIDQTAYGAATKAENLFLGDKVIVKENYDGTEYLAQGTVTAVTASTGAVTVASWETGSTFPSGGFTSGATAFKWQREWIDLTSPLTSQIDGVARLTLRCTDGNEGRNIYLDDFKAGGPYLTTPTATGNVTSSKNRYMQYRAIFNTTDTNVTPALTGATVNYTSGPTMEQLMLRGKWFNSVGVLQKYWWAGR